MKEKLLSIINGPKKLEPIYALEDLYLRKATGTEKIQFLEALKEIATSGTENEVFAALTLIKAIGKVNECEQIIKGIISDLDLQKDQILIVPLLRLCEVISKNWCFEFIASILGKYSFSKNPFIYSNAIRSLVSTKKWIVATNELKNIVENRDNVFVIDLFSYFLWKRGRNDFNRLLKSFDDTLVRRINLLKDKIEERYEHNYSNLRNE